MVDIAIALLQFFSAVGDLVPVPDEPARTAQQQADRLAAQRRVMGVDLETI